MASQVLTMQRGPTLALLPHAFDRFGPDAFALSDAWDFRLFCDALDATRCMEARDRDLFPDPFAPAFASFIAHLDPGHQENLKANCETCLRIS